MESFFFKKNLLALPRVSILFKKNKEKLIKFFYLKLISKYYGEYFSRENFDKYIRTYKNNIIKFNINK